MKGIMFDSSTLNVHPFLTNLNNQEYLKDLTFNDDLML